MSRYTILLGGELVRTPALDRQIAGTRVIAADSGMRHAEALGIVPELWVGDFDSAPPDLPDHLASVPTRKFPSDKDSTDGELAVDIALEQGATALILPALSAAHAPTTRSCTLRWRCGWQRREPRCC
jgi:thiamine pyrophosphokinase